MKLQFHDEAWKDYNAWQSQDKSTLKKINSLIEDIRRHPFTGIGKPEPLRENLSGWWSRRINEADRIVYKPSGDTIIIAACRNHY